MRFRNSRLSAQKQRDTTRFAAKVLEIDNAITIYVPSDNNDD